ncbi:MAG: ferrochelatase [Alphaproteobacteria bacterium]
MPETNGLLLVNLGSPDAPTAKAVRRYLFEFLHDYRVIQTSRWIWCPILHGVILRTRPARSARNYAKVWNAPEGAEAPLVRTTRAQAAAVEAVLGPDVVVDVAMRYGNPSIELAFDRLLAKGCTRIAVLPLYPQYSATTTASVYDGVAKTLKGRANDPEIRLLRNYHTDPAYIAALARSVQTQIGAQGWKPDVVLASFHGIPQAYADKGDPYPQECEETAKLLSAALPNIDLRLTFQSRFGPKQWLEPYTDKTLEALATEGVENVSVITPGFAADCLETLEEIDMEARESFLAAGGKNFSLIPCLNADADHIAVLAKVAREQLLSGWE